MGEDVENILSLFQAAEFNVERTCKGIIYIMKSIRCLRSLKTSITRMSWKVQRALLKIIEGTIANVPPKGGQHATGILQIDTTNICLFAVGRLLVWNGL